jgi:hypothetical protein
MDLFLKEAPEVLVTWGWEKVKAKYYQLLVRRRWQTYYSNADACLQALYLVYLALFSLSNSYFHQWTNHGMLPTRYSCSIALIEQD